MKRIPKPGTETAAALIGTAFSAILLILTAINAGPLWRDETNTFNLAHMPSLRDIWHNLQFESCPLLWPLLVRGWGMLGLTDGDMGIRILGLGIGLFFLTSLWLCQRWIGGRTPSLSIALLGGLPAFIFVVGANRGLRSGGLPAGAQFRQDLADPGVSDEVADPFSRFYLPAVRPNAGPAWAEAHTRRSNLDVVAAFLSHNASAGDLIVVQETWEGISLTGITAAMLNGSAYLPSIRTRYIASIW